MSADRTDRADQPVTPDTTGIPGKTLASQREAMGWSVEQVADQLKLAVRQVVALEAGDYASLPSPAVTRGFVRAYAKIVKLDPIPLVAQIDLGSTGPNTGSSARRERPASFSEVRFPSHGKRSAMPLGIIAGAAVAVLAIAGIAYKFDAFPGMHHAPAVASTTPNAPLTAPGVTSTELQSTSVPLISVPPPSSANTGGGGMSPAGVPATTAATPATASPAAPAAAAPAVGANALVLVAKQDVWLQVRKATGGKPMLSRMVKAGTTETFDVTEPVNLTVGKPDAVDATFRGQPVALPLSPGKTYARVAIK
jgi:cytoskeleton protein RodZ